MNFKNKKILIISNPALSKNGNNGKTLLSFFSNFEQENVYQLYFNNEQPYSNSSNFFRISEIDILKYFFSLGLIKSFGKVQTSKRQSNKSSYVRTLVTNIEPLKKSIRNLLFSLFPSKIYENWIDSFNPDVIFFVGTNYTFSYKILIKIYEKYKLPFSVYFTDDYLLYNNGNNLIENFLHSKFSKYAIDILKNAKDLFVIGPDMKIEYDKLLNKNSKILLNCVNPRFVPNNTFGDVIIFRFFGWLHSNRMDSIVYLNSCLETLNIKYRIEIFTFSEISSDFILNKPNIYINGPIFGEDYDSLLNSSNFLIHAESFEPKNIKVTKLSISTKIPEYLNSNRCIIAIGPKEVSSLKIFENNDIGISLSNINNIDIDICKLKNVIENNYLYSQLCKNALEYSNREFNSYKMIENLKTSLLN